MKDILNMGLENGKSIVLIYGCDKRDYYRVDKEDFISLDNNIITFYHTKFKSMGLNNFDTIKEIVSLDINNLIEIKVL